MFFVVFHCKEFNILLDCRNERTLLEPLLSEDAFIMPCKGILRFCAMSLPVSAVSFFFLSLDYFIFCLCRELFF
jgi:hypothetical protein